MDQPRETLGECNAVFPIHCDMRASVFWKIVQYHLIGLNNIYLFTAIICLCSSDRKNYEITSALDG